MLTIEFHIDFPGREAADILSAASSEVVHITVERETMPRYALCQLTEALRKTLSDFYGGARVLTKEGYDQLIDEQARVHDERGVLDAMGHFHGPASKGDMGR